MSGELGLKTPSGGSISVTATDTPIDKTLILPAEDGAVLVGGAPVASVSSTVSNKIPVVIDGTTYFLLAAASGD
ncbi:MAG: hypothetical protein IBX56_15295 [Methylomicrobium sp.]|nr:hypothetical protein [Methylomicrobium sp.]